MGMLRTNKKEEQFYSASSLSMVDIVPVQDRIKLFPSTRYYGSKRKLLPWIYEHLRTIKFDTVLDGFGGTGSVSLLFKAMGKEVHYHDAFSFNSHVARTVLGDQLSVTKDSFQNFVSAAYAKTGFIQRNFKDMYYLDAENCWIDGFVTELLDADLTEQQVSLYMYTLFQACLKKRPFNLFHRANLNLRTNKGVKRNFGNLTTWERTFTELMLQAYDEVDASMWKGRRKATILPSSDVTEIKPGYDLVYIDPPYISNNEKNNRDDYWKKYHFLEGLSRYERWGELIDNCNSLKAIAQPEKFLRWGRKTSFKEELFGLIKKHHHSIVVLSYVSDAYPDEKDIMQFFEEIFPEVSVHTKEHTHVLSKNKKRELLFIGRP